MKNVSDSDLVMAAREGKREAYGLLVDRYASHVFATCMATLADVDDAADVSQESLLRGFVKIGQLRSPDRFRQWILGIARNLSLDLLRERKKDRTGTWIGSEAGYEPPEDYSEVHAAITRLPENYRSPLLMYYFDGRNTESVALALEISPDGVLTRLSRGRRKLREILSTLEKNDGR